MSKDPRKMNEERQLDVREVARVLRRPEIARLLTAAGRDAATKRRVESWSKGTGLSRDEAAELIAAVLEPLGVVATRVRGFQYWHFPTAEVRRCLHAIDISCTEDSELAKALGEHPAALVRLTILNAIASSRLDGIEIDFQSARDLLLLTRTPRNDPERIVANSFTLHREVAEYAKREPSVELYAEIFERLTEGLSKPSGWLDAARPPELDAGPFTFSTPRKVLVKACAVAGEHPDETGSHAAVIALRLHNLMAVAMPFPMLNGTMGRLAMHIHAVRSGFPVLGAIPYSDVFADWRDGRIGEAEGIRTAFIPPRSPEGAPQFADITPWATVRLQLILHALDRLRAEVDAAQREYESLRALLAVDPSLNRRQRTILGRALEKPETIFRIAYHRTSHDIAYSTARADFVELERKGLLRCEREGHAFVYRAMPDLAKRIAAG